MHVCAALRAVCRLMDAASYSAVYRPHTSKLPRLILVASAVPWNGLTAVAHYLSPSLSSIGAVQVVRMALLKRFLAEVHEWEQSPEIALAPYRSAPVRRLTSAQSARALVCLCVGGEGGGVLVVCVCARACVRVCVCYAIKFPLRINAPSWHQIRQRRWSARGTP
jgi:hypothetical protein